MVLKVLKNWLDQKEIRSTIVSGLQTIKSLSQYKESSEDLKSITEASKLSYGSFKNQSHIKAVDNQKLNSTQQFEENEVAEPEPNYNIQILEPVSITNLDAPKRNSKLKSSASIIDLKVSRIKSRLGTRVTFADKITSNKELGRQLLTSKSRCRGLPHEKRYLTPASRLSNAQTLHTTKHYENIQGKHRQKDHKNQKILQMADITTVAAGIFIALQILQLRLQRITDQTQVRSLLPGSD